MDSADKKHWWQKKTFWGVVLAVIAGGLAELPPLASIRGMLKAIETAGLALAGYGAVEVGRSYAAAVKQSAGLFKGGGTAAQVK